MQVALLRGMKATGRLLVLVQALTSPKLAAVDESAGAIPAPLQVKPLPLLFWHRHEQMLHQGVLDPQI